MPVWRSGRGKKLSLTLPFGILSLGQGILEVNDTYRTVPTCLTTDRENVTDPKTKAWLERSLDKTFGYPGLVRFSWATIKVIMENQGHPVKWYVLCLYRSDGVVDVGDRIDEGQARLIQAFETGAGRDRNRCFIARDLGIKSLGSL
jgi:hypothetical protein